jgi:hypothetical protein
MFMEDYFQILNQKSPASEEKYLDCPKKERIFRKGKYINMLDRLLVETKN